MPDIFSSFDPGLVPFQTKFPSIFLILQLLMIMFVMNPHHFNQRQFNILSLPMNFMSQQVARTTGSNLKGTMPLLASLMVVLTAMNLTGLIPYAFSFTSHLAFSMTLSIPLWLALVLSSFPYNMKAFMAHLTPSHAPIYLALPLVFIEVISILVRPITLGVRLAANMTAGHVVMSLLGILLSWSLFTFPFYGKLMTMLVCTLYTLFEVGICLIQSYIFCLLLSLYTNDHPTAKFTPFHKTRKNIRYGLAKIASLWRGFRRFKWVQLKTSNVHLP